MSADRRIAAFLTLASEELHAAEMLAQGAPRQAAYHLQQAAKLALARSATPHKYPLVLQ